MFLNLCINYTSETCILAIVSEIVVFSSRTRTITMQKKEPFRPVWSNNKIICSIFRLFTIVNTVWIKLWITFYHFNISVIPTFCNFVSISIICLFLRNNVRA